jgi:hypothetical protein
MKGEEFAKSEELPAPCSWPDLAKAIFQGCDIAALVSQQAVSQHGPKQAALEAVTRGLQVAAVIQSYNIAAVAQEYVAGTRKWLYTAVEDWLSGLDPTSADRMFVLLADPGMGKSVFSAVIDTQLAARLYAKKKGQTKDGEGDAAAPAPTKPAVILVS